MISYHAITESIRKLGISRENPLLIALDKGQMQDIKGGVATFMGAVLASVDNMLIPTFTLQTMVVPQSGPQNNAIVYGSNKEENLSAKIFTPDLPVEPVYQQAKDILATYPATLRSGHPIYSFFGLGLDIALLKQTNENPYAPIQHLAEMDGWILMMENSLKKNFVVHTAEMTAGRKQFTRWALTPDGIAACLHCPGCSRGFHKLLYYIKDELNSFPIGKYEWFAMPIKSMIQTAAALIKEDAFALLCNDLKCRRCNAVREDVRSQVVNDWQREK